MAIKSFIEERGEVRFAPDFITIHKIVSIEEHFATIIRLKQLVSKSFKQFMLFGGYSAEATPVPISNTEVKLCCANDTAWETVWESRSPPNFYLKRTHDCGSFFIPESAFMT